MVQVACASRKEVSVVHAGGAGSFLVLLEVARQQGLFHKFGVDVRPIAVHGAAVPRLSRDKPIGLIGAPAALLQAADGADLRLVASFSNTRLSGHLVARSGIESSEGLRGKRVGVRVVGAGIWISTILALERLGLDVHRDNITTVPIGSPVEIVRALEEGAIDGALVAVAQSRGLQAKGFSVLLQDYPPDIASFEGGLAVATGYLSAHPDIVENVTVALTEALAFSLAKENRLEVMKAFKISLDISDPDTAASNLRELKQEPYPSLMTLKEMQRIMGTYDARVLEIDIENLIDDRLVRKLDESGTIAGLYASYDLK
jgi:ABC-type nitrate/sulfonate/bicarbonate transport system substrate-binding protein